MPMAAIILLGFCLLASASESRERPTLSIQYSGLLLDLVGIQPGTRPYLKSLREAQESRTRGSKVPGEILGRLVEDLTDGPAQGSLARALEDSTHVGGGGDRSKAGPIRWGTFFEQREWVLNQLADEAMRLADRDRVKARRYAQACFVLAAEEGLLTANTVPVVWMLKRNGLAELAGLSEKTVDRIRKHLSEFNSTVDVIPSAKALDRSIAWLRENPPPLPREHVATIEGTLGTALRANARHPMDERMIAEVAWRAMCLGRAINDGNLQERLVRLAREHQSRMSSFGERLMEEAMTQPGPRPESSGFGYFESPDAWKPRR